MNCKYMKIATKIIEGESYSQVFVNKEELEKKEVKDKIHELKVKGNKVGIFISGMEEILPIIKNNIIYTFGNT